MSTPRARSGLSKLRRAAGASPLTALLALALLLRLLVPAGPMPAMDPLTELLSGGGICHGDPDAPAQPADPSCLLCPLCLAPLPALAAAAMPPVAAPALAAIARAGWPPATAPPAAPHRLAQPRAPPASA